MFHAYKCSENSVKQYNKLSWIHPYLELFCLMGDKPLYKTMMAQFNDVQKSLGLNGLNTCMQIHANLPCIADSAAKGH